MYYSSGNYEAFARPRKPEGVDNKSAHIIGTGLAALTAACYLVRDGQMQGQNIHIYEKEPIPGGACDGWQYPDVGYMNTLKLQNSISMINQWIFFRLLLFKCCDCFM